MRFPENPSVDSLVKTKPMKPTKHVRPHWHIRFNGQETYVPAGEIESIRALTLLNGIPYEEITYINEGDHESVDGKMVHTDDPSAATARVGSGFIVAHTKEQGFIRIGGMLPIKPNPNTE